MIRDEDLIPENPYKTSLEVELEEYAVVNSETVVKGVLTNTETEDPISDVLIYITIEDKTFATLTGEDGEYEQTIKTPSTPGLTSVTTKFLGDYEYEPITHSTLLSITLDDPYSLQTLADSVDEIDPIEAEVIDGTCTVALPEELSGIWEVTATYPQQDIYKYSQLVEEVQFNRTPYFTTIDGESYYTAQVNYPITVKAQLCDSDGTPLGNRTVTTKYAEYDGGYTLSDNTTTDSDGYVSRTITRYIIGDTGSLLFHYGGDKGNLNPCDLEVSLEWLPYEIKVLVNDPTRLYTNIEGAIAPIFYYYETPNDESENRKGYLNNKEVTLEVLGTTYTLTTDSQGVASLVKTFTEAVTFDCYYAWKGNSTYQAVPRTSFKVEVMNYDGSKIDTMFSIQEDSQTVQRACPITYTGMLTDEYGNPLKNQKVVTKTAQMQSDGEWEEDASSINTYTNEAGLVTRTVEYRKVGQVKYTFKYGSNNMYNGCSETAIGTWTKYQSELICGDICCIVGEVFDVKVKLQWTGCDGVVHSMKNQEVIFGHSGQKESVYTDENSYAILEGYSRGTTGKGVMTVTFEGNDDVLGSKIEIDIYAYANEENVDPQETVLEMQPQLNGDKDKDEDGNNYYYGVNEQAQIRVLLRKKDGEEIVNRELTATIHNLVTGEDDVVKAMTNSYGIAKFVYNGENDFWLKRQEAGSNIWNVDIDWAGDYCYKASSTSMKIQWLSIEPVIEVADVYHHAGVLTQFEANLYYTTPGEPVNISDAEIGFIVKDKTYTGTTDEDGHCVVNYMRTTTGTWTGNIARYGGSNLFNDVEKQFTITTVDDVYVETHFQLTGDPDLSVECKQPVTWIATLLDEYDGLITGQKATSKIGSETMLKGDGLESYMNEIYTDLNGQITTTYANTSRIPYKTYDSLDEAYYMETKSADTTTSNTGDRSFLQATVTGSVTWKMITPVLFTPDLTSMSGSYIDVDAYFYYYNYQGVLKPMQNAVVLLHLDSSGDKEITTDANGKCVYTNYKRESTGTATPHWTYEGKEGIFNEVKEYFDLTTYEADNPPVEVGTKLTVGKTQYNVECSHNTPVSVTLSLNDGTVLANKRIKTSISTAYDSSTSTPTDNSFDNENYDVQYVTTDSNGVATRVFDAPEKEELANGKYYFMRFEFNDTNNNLAYGSSKVDALLYTTTISPVITARNIERKVGDKMYLRAKLHYTTDAGTFNPIGGRELEFVFDDTHSFYVTTSEGSSTDKASIGLAELIFDPSEYSWFDDVSGSRGITVNYDNDYNEAQGHKMYFQKASSKLTIISGYDGDD